MQLQHFARIGTSKAWITLTRSIQPKTQQLLFRFSSQPHEEVDSDPQKREHPTTSPLASPSKIQKLIASQSDPLLAKEIFDLASLQSNFRHTYSTYITLILKLGRSNHFSLVDKLLIHLQAENYPINPILFSDLIKIYGEANMLDKAYRTFYTMIEFSCKPLTNHLNRILEILVSNRTHVRVAFDLLNDARNHGVLLNTKSYNIILRALCTNGDLSIAYQLFNKMFKRDLVPDVESYRILMQGLCRKGQVNTAVDFLEDMFNKGFVPDTLIYTTLLNSLCRKKKLKEAYKLLCRMNVKGCNPDIVHYNTVILGFCREGLAIHACKVFEDMESNGCLPNLVSYRTLISGLCEQGMLKEAKKYIEEMRSKGLSPHFSVIHALTKGLCNVGKVEEACGVLEERIKHEEVPHVDTWAVLVPRVWEGNEMEIINKIEKEVAKDRNKARQ